MVTGGDMECKVHSFPTLQLCPLLGDHRHTWESRLERVSRLQSLHTAFPLPSFSINQGLMHQGTVPYCPLVLAHSDIFSSCRPLQPHKTQTCPTGPEDAMTEIVLYVVLLGQAEEVAAASTRLQ